MISFEKWQETELRVGKIKEVSEIEGKDKLYKLNVSFGEEERQVVAGLKPFYLIDDLKGKKAIFVYNLAPVTLAGLESQAMILAAKNNEGKFKVMFVDDSIEEGTRLE